MVFLGGHAWAWVHLPQRGPAYGLEWMAGLGWESRGLMGWKVVRVGWHLCSSGGQAVMAVLATPPCGPPGLGRVPLSHNPLGLKLASVAPRGCKEICWKLREGRAQSSPLSLWLQKLCFYPWGRSC